MKKRILVISSANMDFVMNMSRIPSAGETMIEKNQYSYIPGGKGGNSALAFSKLGGDCVFCTRVGNDAHGARLRKVYKANNIDTRFTFVDKTAKTGLAAIIVEENGTNRIVVYPGANFKLTCHDVEEAFTCYPDAVFLQFEIPDSPVIAACEFAAKQGVPVFIDAGPARKDFPLERLGKIEVFSPNETETEIYTGIAPNTVETCLRAAIRLSSMVKAKYYVLKLGERGAFVYDGRYHRILPSLDVRAVDTTAAGDAFSAALTLEYLRTGDIYRACEYGNIVGAITVQRKGAATSIPTAEEVDLFIQERGIDR
ncbi:MAG: ribokinase [Clostridiales bacterium]|nr:ribokinase [Clostridiales bacterium]